MFQLILLFNENLKKKKGFAIDFVLFIFHPRSLRENENILKTILNMLIKDKGWHVTMNISLELSLGYIFTTLETKEGEKKKGTKKVITFSPTLILSSLEKAPGRGRCHFNTIMEQTICGSFEWSFQKPGSCPSQIQDIYLPICQHPQGRAASLTSAVWELTLPLPEAGTDCRHLASKELCLQWLK